MGGAIPLGYYKDPEKTAATFRTVNGVRYSIPGDYATVDADGTIRLLGRGSASINTGGEKVYPEEVELVLREHPPSTTASSSGVPTSDSARWSWRSCDARPVARRRRPHRVESRAARRLQAPEALELPVVDSLQRSAAGKADHPRLRTLAAELAASDG